MSLAKMNYMGGKRKDSKLLWGQVRFDAQVRDVLKKVGYTGMELRTMA